MTRLIYLNGTSSSGKSTLAKALQPLLSEPFLLFSIDTLLYTLPPAELEAMMGRVSFKRDLDWSSLFSGYFACVRALLDHGNRVIADCPVYNQDMANRFHDSLHDIDQHVVVKVECSLEVAEQREKSRRDRVIGLARRQFPSVHDYLSYDEIVNTEAEKPRQAAERLKVRLK